MADRWHLPVRRPVLRHMPYQAINTAAPVVHRPSANAAITNIRLYVRNTNENGKVGVQEFSATGVRK